MANVSRKIYLLSRILNKYTTRNLQHTQVGGYSTLISKLVYSEFGNPAEVVQLVEENLDSLKPNEILIKMIAAPINPADINTIQGTYPSLPKLPAVGGNEGVGEVVEVGPDVKSLSVGDRVIPLSNNSGTWGTHLILNEKFAFKVPTELGLLEAATLKVNPCTAYRMLRDFVDLKAGDTVIQNGANSACGQYVIQLCKEWGINTVNIVRNRPNIDDLKISLERLGATHVLTEEELKGSTLFKDEVIPKPLLALNCVGGKNAMQIFRHLGHGACMVTYGGMSRQPVMVPTSALIFKDIKILGFWMTRWAKENFDSPAVSQMYHDIIKLMIKGKLLGPLCEMVEFDEYKQALENAINVKGMLGKKYVLKYG